MATTRIISMHINKGKTIAQCLKARVDYIENPEKTNGGELISSYACSPETADQEFLHGFFSFTFQYGVYYTTKPAFFPIKCLPFSKAVSVLPPTFGVFHRLNPPQAATISSVPRKGRLCPFVPVSSNQKAPSWEGAGRELSAKLTEGVLPLRPPIKHLRRDEHRSDVHRQRGKENRKGQRGNLLRDAFAA